MMGEANPNLFVSMWQDDIMDCMTRLYHHNPVLWINGVWGNQVNGVVPDAKTLDKEDQHSGLKWLGYTTAKAVPDPREGVLVIPWVTKTKRKPPRGKPLTPFRKRGIQVYNDMIDFIPDQGSHGMRMWSPSWIEGLVLFMKQFKHPRLAPVDVANWLRKRKSKAFFPLELARLQAKQKPLQNSPDPACQSPSQTTSPTGGGTVRPLAEMGCKATKPKPNHDEFVPVMASAPESSSDSRDGYGLDAEAVMMDFISLVEDNNQPEDELEFVNPESVFNSLAKWSPQPPSGIEEITPTPSNDEWSLINFQIRA